MFRRCRTTTDFIPFLLWIADTSLLPPQTHIRNVLWQLFYAEPPDLPVPPTLRFYPAVCPGFLLNLPEVPKCFLWLLPVGLTVFPLAASLQKSYNALFQISRHKLQKSDKLRQHFFLIFSLSTQENRITPIIQLHLFILDGRRCSSPCSQPHEQWEIQAPSPEIPYSFSPRS